MGVVAASALAYPLLVCAVQLRRSPSCSPSTSARSCCGWRSASLCSVALVAAVRWGAARRVLSPWLLLGLAPPALYELWLVWPLLARLTASGRMAGVTVTSRDPRAAPPRRERVEQGQPLHRLGGRAPVGEGPRRGRARRPAARPSTTCCPTSCTPRCCKRAITTAELALAEADRQWIPVRRSWRLNERHYGALQGKDKAATLAEYGEEQFMIWRRSYDTPPPPIEPGSEFSQDGDPRYAVLPPEARPATECLADVVVRMLPYWYDAIVPDLRSGATVLVAAHGNSLRALVKHLDGMGDDEVVGLNIPTGVPLRYDLDDDLRPIKPGGAVPRPRGRGRRDRGRQEPGKVS